MIKLLIIGLGGFIGAIARYGISGVVQRYGGGFPLGTMAVNVLGCVIIGGFLYLVETRAVMAPNLRLFLGIGILGAFTTFSTFGYETIELLGERQIGFALLNIAGNLILGLGAVWLGRTIMRVLQF